VTADLASRLRAHVVHLAETIGERNVFTPDALERAAQYVEMGLAGPGITIGRQQFEVRGRTVRNVEAERRGSHPSRIVVVGAHYDSVLGSPGANDNATGVAALLELARLSGGRAHAATLRFVGFVNEEPPFFQTEDMGSLRYARRCRERKEDVAAMLSLETMGTYDDRAGSQAYPFPLSALYPSTANFIAVVGDLGAASLVRRVTTRFRQATAFPCESAALPGVVPGVGWSDHWAFREAGYPAVMITDTALFRDPAYHTAEDKPGNVDHERLAIVVTALGEVIRDLTTARL
jgi:Zn-dependent M28 family amino/carboxypeptidase